MGFALGWNYLMKYLIVTPNNVNAAGKTISPALLVVANIFMSYELTCIGQALLSTTGPIAYRQGFG